MRIIVNDIAASCGGAMSILRQFYEYIKENDKENEWIFLLSGEYFAGTENISVIVKEKVKRNGLQKILFDCIYGRRFISRLNPDIVFSLQNIITFGVKAPQIVYIHQSIPFQKEKRFSFFKKRERKLAFYQYIVGGFIKKSAKKADGIIVQTKWMKDAVCKATGVGKEKVLVALPDVSDYEYNPSIDIQTNQFFYPTTNEIYKNIDCIIRACDCLNEIGIKDFSVKLTLEPGTVNHPNIECIGLLEKEQMQKLYQSSVLLFPSYIETIGLPLLEAKQCNTMIIASDCVYSKEVLIGYENVSYFNPWKPEELADQMKKVITEAPIHIVPINRDVADKNSSWFDVYNYLKNGIEKSI